MGVDRVQSVLDAYNGGRLLTTDEHESLPPAAQERLAQTRRKHLLQVARENEAGEIASATYEILLMRRSTPGFTEVDAETLQLLHTWQRTGMNRPELPDRIDREARRLVITRMRGARGEIPRTKPVSRADRSRMRTYYNPSFRKQLGRRLDTENDKQEVKKLIAELNRQVKNRQVPVYSTNSTAAKSD
jgi:hypothetical protein